jgi:hypothetical protein
MPASRTELVRAVAYYRMSTDAQEGSIPAKRSWAARVRLRKTVCASSLSLRWGSPPGRNRLSIPLRDPQLAFGPTGACGPRGLCARRSVRLAFGAVDGPADISPGKAALYRDKFMTEPNVKATKNSKPRSARYGCNVDTLMKHYVSLDEQQVTDDVFSRIHGAKKG